MAINKVTIPLNYLSSSSGLPEVIRQINDLRQQISDFAAVVNSCPLLYGSGPFEVTIVAAGSVTIFHTLSKIPVGYAILSVTGTADYMVNVVSKDATTIVLQNNGATNITVSVWVI